MQPSYNKAPGYQPLPGYTLIEPLGRGGFGEVWKCEVPGGLHKAVKFVAGGTDGRPSDGAQLRQEYDAFQQVKAIRHPFLLCLERVELVDNELVMVMGLADRHIGERFQECRSGGLPGIPRDELIGYLKEAAEALDVISAQFGLQHLDVKPANLFLTAGHVQVGDYGLVSKLDGGTGSGKNRGLTPKYAAPEVLRGGVHTRSDQYSLALVYQELLTDTFPYSGRTPQQLMMQHVSAVPDVSGLSERDRGPVMRALAKSPEDRFPSCRDFIEALAQAEVVAPSLSLVIPKPRKVGSTGDLSLTPAPPRSRELVPASQATRGPSVADESTQRSAPPVLSGSGVPRLVGIERTRPSGVIEATPPPKASSPPAAIAQPAAFTKVKVQKILSVLPVGWLRGREAPDPDLPPADMIRAVLAAASPGSSVLSSSTGAARLADGTWECRCLTTIDPRLAKVKLDLLWEKGRVKVDSHDPNRVVFRQIAPVPVVPSGLFGAFGKKVAPPPPSGLEVVVRLPETGGKIGEVVATGQMFGTPPLEFSLNADQAIVGLLEGVRRQLNNFQDRRKHPRVPANFSVTLFPLHSDGRVETPLSGQCCDVSAGGIALRTSYPPPCEYLYVAFEGVRGTTGLAILVQIVRRQRQDDGIIVCGRYRQELWPQPSA